MLARTEWKNTSGLHKILPSTQMNMVEGGGPFLALKGNHQHFKEEQCDMGEHRPIITMEHRGRPARTELHESSLKMTRD